MLATGDSLADRLAEIRRQHGDAVSIDDVADIVASRMQTIEGDLAVSDLRLRNELNELLDFIRRARAEIAALQPQEISERQIPTATDELDAVVHATEAATGVFLDAAEELETMSAEFSGSAAERLSGIATRIYEASNFQDITGQRISKVVSTLRDIEARVYRMSLIDGGSPDGASPRAPHARDNGERDLLNGPALPGAANSQEDIDALLASFD